MKRAIALLLALSLLLALCVLPASAAGEAATDAVQMVQALGIMNGDESGNLNLEKPVTRAEFCKMLVAASTYKDTVGGAGGYSLFKDVKSDHWAVEYIKVSVENGWFTGYTDGTFRPNQSITLEEAATVALRLLGYTAADLGGSYPTAQLSKFEALGLHAGFTTGRGQTMSRSDCAYLFYNLMAAKTKEGQVYAQTLGYTLDATGHVDYAALVTANTSGPFILTSGAIQDSLSFTPTAVYRNGVEAQLTDADLYDVYYYNPQMRTVWIYSNRVTGTYTAASPSTVAPTSVTVAGVSYSIESSTAAYQLSTQGEYGIGDTVTLLLGMNGGVAGVCDASEATGVYYGVVTGTSEQSITSSDGSIRVAKMVSVICTDGVERTFESASSSYSAGSLVKMDYGASSTASRLSQKSIQGKVNASGTKLGDKVLAEDVEILDTDSYGNVKRIYPSRLAGYTLSSSNVLFYACNARDEITHLILRDATGDLGEYGLVLSSQERLGQGSAAGVYQCLINGENRTITSSNTIYSISSGAARFVYEGGQITSIRSLQEVKLTAISATEAASSGRNYPVSETVQVYLKKGDNYYKTTIQAVADPDAYTLTGYYDALGAPAGGQIRVVVAQSK